MSVRGFDSRFNLRNVVEQETAFCPLVAVEAEGSKLDRKPVTKSVLKFDFTSVLKPNTALPTKALATNESTALSKLNVSFGHKPESGLVDVMRLRATVDDLSTRLKRANDKTTFAETELNRVRVHMISERVEFNNKICSAREQLKEAGQVETQLRKELCNNAKAVVEYNEILPKFKEAVAAALASENTANEQASMIAELQMALKEQTKEAKNAVVETNETKEKNVQLHNKMMDVEAQLEKSKEAEMGALAQRDKLSNTLQAAAKRIAELAATDVDVLNNYTDGKDNDGAEEEALLEDNDHYLSLKIAQIEARLEKAKDSERNAIQQRDVVAEALKENIETMNSALCQTCDRCCSSFVDAKHSQTPLDVTPEVDKVVDGRRASNFPDPFKMHARYNRLRDAIVKVSSCITTLELEQQESNELEALRLKRNDLLTRANDLKLRYDTVFGATTTTSTTSVVDTTPSVEVQTSSAVDHALYLPLGDPPPQPPNRALSFAKKMSQSSHFGGAFDFGLYDSGIHVGSHCMPPVKLEAQSDDVDDIGNVNTSNKMVDAVVADLADFLKHFKENEMDEIAA